MSSVALVQESCTLKTPVPGELKTGAVGGVGSGEPPYTAVSVRFMSMSVAQLNRVIPVSGLTGAQLSGPPNQPRKYEPASGVGVTVAEPGNGVPPGWMYVCQCWQWKVQSCATRHVVALVTTAQFSSEVGSVSFATYVPVPPVWLTVRT
jgi:hypothetical protein